MVGNSKRVYKIRGLAALQQLLEKYIDSIPGLPNNNYFPFDTLESAAALPTRFEPTPNKPVDPSTEAPTSHTSKPLTASQVVVPKTSSEENILRKVDLKSALQYGTAQGYPALYTFLRQFTTENLHPNIPYKDGPEIILTCGNTDGFSKTLEALSNEWVEERDGVAEKEGLLCEEFAFMSAIQAARPRGLNIAPVKVDSEGMTASGPGGLSDVLENWDFSRGKRPHIMYTVTVGQNPTSGILSITRRKEIYALCVQYDIVIVEDDPYWYLQYPSANAANFSAAKHDPSPLPNQKSSGYDFLDSLVPSYLSVDTQGRVVRLDTFSKTIAPGCRLGWITTQPALCERLLRITETSTQQPSGFVQSMIAQLIMGPSPSDTSNGPTNKNLATGWKTDGWIRWLEGLRGEYERRMQTLCHILGSNAHLVKTGRRPSLTTDNEDDWAVVSTARMYSFATPMGGMFLWLRLHLDTHPLASKVPLPKLAYALWVYLTTPKYLLLVAPGQLFAPTEEIKVERSWMYFRICFAAVDEDVVEAMSWRFVEACRSFWRKKSVDDIEELAAQERVEGMEGLGWVC